MDWLIVQVFSDPDEMDFNFGLLGVGISGELEGIYDDELFYFWLIELLDFWIFELFFIFLSFLEIYFDLDEIGLFQKFFKT